MRYAMLVYYNEPDYLALPESERTRLMDECTRWGARLVAERRSVGGMCLEPTATATTLRTPSRKLTLFDGPFAETKEVLGGFVVLDCENLDQAIELARGFPFLQAGFSLELRPVAACDLQASAAT